MCTQERTYPEYSLFLDWKYVLPCSQVTLEAPKKSPPPQGETDHYGVWAAMMYYLVGKYSKWFIFPFSIFWGRGAHVCMHVCMGSAPMWVHMHMFVHACRASGWCQDSSLDCSSTLFEKTGCLSQAQSSLIGQDSLAGLLWGSCLHLPRVYLQVDCYARLAFQGSLEIQALSSHLHSVHLNHGALSQAWKMNFNRQSYKVTMSLLGCDRHHMSKVIFNFPLYVKGMWLKLTLNQRKTLG